LHEFGICYHTEVALRALTLSERQVRSYINGHDSGKKYQKRVDSERLKIVRHLRLETVQGQEKARQALKGRNPMYAPKVEQRWFEMLLFIDSSSV
jgi:hypothetical protein